MTRNLLNRWYKIIGSRDVLKVAVDMVFNEVFEALLDDMNTPLAISLLSARGNEIIKSRDASGEMAKIFVNTCRILLGLSMNHEKVPGKDRLSDEQIEYIESRISERNAAKNSKNFEKADEIRDQLLGDGIIIEDTKTGSKWRIF
jgi:cysteinyl-tRNA synthetase